MQQIGATVMPNFTLTRGSQMIGDTLFIDGSPHHVCGHCGCIINSSDYERKLQSRGATKSKGKIVRDGKITYESKPYKITILLGWLQGEDKHTVVDGFPTVEHKWIPRLKQAFGCFACWNTQEHRKLQSSKLGDWAYDAKHCNAPKLGVTTP